MGPMRPHMVVASLLLVACPSGDDTSDASTTGDTEATTATTGAPPTTGEPGTTGLMPRCFPPVQGDYAFYFEPDPDPGFGECEVTGVDPLKLACTDDFTLKLGSSKDPGLVIGDRVQVDYRREGGGGGGPRARGCGSATTSGGSSSPRTPRPSSRRPRRRPGFPPASR